MGVVSTFREAPTRNIFGVLFMNPFVQKHTLICSKRPIKFACTLIVTPEIKIDVHDSSLISL